MVMDFPKEFCKEIATDKPDWLVKGILSSNDLLYGFGTDTKILSRVFELLSFPFIKKVADTNKYIIEVSSEQTVYPDFTLYKSKESKEKIAIDIKSTYRRYSKNGKSKPFNFTLGSYTSFLRNNTKNILYPYDEYATHWVIGFVYDRENIGSKSLDIVALDDRDKVKSPFKNVEFFVQEKYKISGEDPGSGNTANIGSIYGTLSDFENGNSPFAKLGEKVFRDYWANYGRFKPRPYNNLKGYSEWKKSQKK